MHVAGELGFMHYTCVFLLLALIQVGPFGSVEAAPFDDYTLWDHFDRPALTGVTVKGAYDGNLHQHVIASLQMSYSSLQTDRA